jgi:hypothetical protein
MVRGDGRRGLGKRRRVRLPSGVKGAEPSSYESSQPTNSTVAPEAAPPGARRRLSRRLALLVLVFLPLLVACRVKTVIA